MMRPLRLLLGTAQWGWTTSAREAYALLDYWLKAGYSEIDAATNYPINKQPEDFRAAERILQEYVYAHGLKNELRITMKVGSVNNLRTPEINLEPSFIMMMAEEYHRILGECLSGIMVHWDNRAEAPAIRDTCSALQYIAQNGVRPGLSGILHPDLYAGALEGAFSLDIELKHNALVSDYPRYHALTQSGQHQVLAYGINAGGVKLSGQYADDSTFTVRGGNTEVWEQRLKLIEDERARWNTAFTRPPVVTMNHVGLIFAGLHPGIHGIVVGAKHPGQIQETLDYIANLYTFDYGDVFGALNKMVS